MSKKEINRKVVILGSGPAGLTAAFTLRARSSNRLSLTDRSRADN
jgi:thioredoxin reductase